MSSVNHDEFMPTIFLAIKSENGKDVFYQLWTTALGVTEFRPVPMIETTLDRKPSIAGYLEGDDDE